MNCLMHMLADNASFWLPQGASDLAGPVDNAWNVILYVTGFFFFIVVGTMLFFIIRYRRRTPNDATPEITHNTVLELAWTLIPLVIVEIFFFVGFKGFLRYDTPRSDAKVIDVQGRQWAFTFTYPNGAQDPDLYLLKDEPVRLNLSSADVLHAIYLPVFRTQRNLIPGRETQISFTPTDYSPKDGWFIFCTQYCGNGHSRMFSHVYVLSKAEYTEKMKQLANPFKKKDPITGKSRWVPYVELGHTLYQQNCSSCHSVTDDKIIVGPPWKGLWKRHHDFHYVQPGSVDAPAGTTYTLEPTDSDQKWLDYLNESILKPNAKLVKYQDKNLSGMSDFSSTLSGSEINDEKRRAIIEYIKSLGNLPYTPAVPPDSPFYDADKYPDNPPESLKGLQEHGLTPATQSQPVSR